MNSNTHTIKRLITGLVLATALAALAIPSALAGNSSRYGAPDGWYPYVVSLTKASTASRYGPQDGWYPYAVSLTTARHTAVLDGRSPDTIDAATQAHIPVVTVIQQPGFQWGDFGIGVAAALGLTCLLAVAIRLLTAHKSRKQPGSVATA
jgi:hypothetical protein